MADEPIKLVHDPPIKLDHAPSLSKKANRAPALAPAGGGGAGTGWCFLPAPAVMCGPCGTPWETVGLAHRAHPIYPSGTACGGTHGGRSAQKWSAAAEVGTV